MSHFDAYCLVLNDAWWIFRWLAPAFGCFVFGTAMQMRNGDAEPTMIIGAAIYIASLYWWQR